LSTFYCSVYPAVCHTWNRVLSITVYYVSLMMTMMMLTDDVSLTLNRRRMTRLWRSSWCWSSPLSLSWRSLVLSSTSAGGTPVVDKPLLTPTPRPVVPVSTLSTHVQILKPVVS